MSDKMRREPIVRTVPDMEDWWGDFDVNVPPPPLPQERRTRRGMSLGSQAAMLLMCVVFVACMCAQIYRVSVINAQNKQIQKLTAEIEGLNSNLQGLEIKINALASLEKIEATAIDKLGMVKPEPDQIRVIAIGNTNENLQTANAAPEESEQEDPAP